MPGVCILTDSTAQFPAASFPGQELVSIIPFQIKFNGKQYPDGKDLKITDLPLSAREPSSPVARPPTLEEFRQMYLSLGTQYSEIVALLLSPHLSPAIQNAQGAIHSLGWVPVTVIDSQTTGAGLGLLVQAAAEAAQGGANSLEIKHLLHSLVDHVYTVFCLQSLTYLAQTGYLDTAQALVGEMLDVTALFVLESGRLVPVQKARNERQLVDILYEFIYEFGDLKHVALARGVVPFDNEARSLRERVSADFPTAVYTEHIMGTALASILGPRSLGLVAMED